MDAFDRIMELSRQGLYCAQIMVQLALDAEGKENPELVQAVRGLCGGFAWSGGPCGVLSGGVCFLSLLGRELPAEEKIELIGQFHARVRVAALKRALGKVRRARQRAALRPKAITRKLP